jgi:hypothetical protein
VGRMEQITGIDEEGKSRGKEMNEVNGKNGQ